MRNCILLGILIYLSSCHKAKDKESYISFEINGSSRTTKSIVPAVQDGRLVAFTGNFTNGASIGFLLTSLPSQTPGKYNFREGKMFPAQFISFSAKAENYWPKLKWTTGSETTLSKFEIEKALNTTDFTKIGEVSATNTSLPASYEFSDTTITTIGKAYYRIKAVDNGGKFIYSTVIVIYLTYVACYSEGSIQYKAYNGNLEITSYDSSKHLFSGNFSFDIKTNSGEVEKIRNGSFTIYF